MITRAELLQLVSYDPDVGAFTWIRDSGPARAGKVAGNNAHGYWQLCIAGRKYYAHRLVWLYVHGTWPPHEIDHINGDKSDNRIINLRIATHFQNNANKDKTKRNKSGCRGVYWHARAGKWAVQIRSHNTTHSLGLYQTLEHAISARKTAEREINGAFAWRGRSSPDANLCDCDTYREKAGEK